MIQFTQVTCGDSSAQLLLTLIRLNKIDLQLDKAISSQQKLIPIARSFTGKLAVAEENAVRNNLKNFKKIPF